MCLHYSRSSLGQTGSGHFSPLGAYDPDSDRLLVLDVARFKYPPHWVTVSDLWEAMKGVDSDTGNSRGYAMVSIGKEADEGGSISNDGEGLLFTLDVSSPLFVPAVLERDVETVVRVCVRPRKRPLEEKKEGGEMRKIRERILGILTAARSEDILKAGSDKKVLPQ